MEHRSACAVGMRIPARSDACCGSHREWHLKLALLLSFCLALALSASSLPQTQSRTEASATVSKARALLQQGNTEQVIKLLSHYLQAHSKDSYARLTLGQAYAIAGRNDRATDEFETVLREAPTNYVALAALGEIYYRANQLERAEPLLARAAKLSQGTPQIRMEWAIVLARLHRYKEAKNALVGVPVPKGAEDGIAYHRLKASIEAGLGGSAEAAVQMEKALALKPDDAGLAIGTAAAELQNKNWARAAELAEPVFSWSDDPGAGLVLLEAQLGMSADYHSTLGKLRSASLPPEQEGEFRERLAQILIDHSKTAEAVQELTKAAELHPDRANVIFNLALARYRAGLLDDAIASAERCKTLGDSAEVEDLLGDLQEARGDNLAAVRSYQAAVSLAPGEEKYRLSLALELIQHKSFDAAKAVLEQAEGLRPESWRIQLALGMVEHFAGTDEAASQILLRAANLVSDPLIALKYIGEIQMDQASPPDPAALAKLCQYANAHPSEGNMQLYCGALLFRRDYASGEKTGAEEILRRLQAAGRLLPANAAPHCQLGKAYRRMGRWQEALSESRTCVQMDPDSAEGHYRLAQIYQHAGQQAQSEEEMKLYEAASKKVADENARRDETIKTFLYTIRKDAPDRN